MRTKWITQAQAAEIVGCARQSIDRYVQAGHIARRYPLGRKTPTLDRASVEEFANWWKVHELEKQQRRQSGTRPPAGPPDDGDVWLDSVTASLVVGISPQYLGRLALAERLPAERDRRTKKWWFRRRDVEQFAAARAFQKRLSVDHVLIA